jgi:hypothetical protein
MNNCKSLSEPCGRKKFAFITSVCVAVIIGYAKTICTKHASKNKKSEPLLTEIGIWNLTGWSLTHVAFYAFLGFMFPTDFKLLMLMGVIWEILEQYVLNGVEWAKADCIDDVWWYGRVSDLFMNAIGFWLGYAIFRKSINI